MSGMNLDEEMRRFEMELAGGSSSSSSSRPIYPQAPQQQQGASIASAPVRFIPHQLLRGGMVRGGMMPPRPSVFHAPPQPNQNQNGATFNFPMFPPQMMAAASSFSAPLPQSVTIRPQVTQSNVLQVSANKAMLDAQKAMAMQTKEPPVMGPQVTPKLLEDTALSNKAKKKIKYVRTAGGEIWQDTSLSEWDPNDFRIFCGDLGNEVNDEALARAFRKYPSFQKAKVVREKKSNKSKGYGFVSFKDPNDFVRAMKEMNGKYVGNRPIKLRKSAWKDRQLDVARKRVKEKHKLGMRA